MSKKSIKDVAALYKSVQQKHTVNEKQTWNCKGSFHPDQHSLYKLRNFSTNAGF